MARLDTSLRQRTDHMKVAAGLARSGNFKESFQSLGVRVIGSWQRSHRLSRQTPPALPDGDRDRTAIYSSGRERGSRLTEWFRTACEPKAN